MNYPTRPIEWLHSVQCQAKAVIAAVENLRDTHLEARADTRHLALDMRVALQENMPLQWADEYLASGTTQCICPEPWPDEASDDETVRRMLFDPLPPVDERGPMVVRNYHVVPLTNTVVEGHEFVVPE